MKIFRKAMATTAGSIAALAISALPASAKTIELWHGWMNLDECRKVEWRNDGLFGTPSPTYISGPQELHGRIKADLTSNGDELIGRVQQVATNCAIQGAAASGATALITGGPGAWEAFSGTFQACIANTSIAQYLIQFRLETDSFCRW